MLDRHDDLRAPCRLETFGRSSYAEAHAPAYGARREPILVGQTMKRLIALGALGRPLRSPRRGPRASTAPWSSTVRPQRRTAASRAVRALRRAAGLCGSIAPTPASYHRWYPNTIGKMVWRKSSRLRRRLELHGARISLVDEFCASQCCSCCGVVHAAKRCLACAKAARDVHRGTNAARNIANVRTGRTYRPSRPEA